MKIISRGKRPRIELNELDVRNAIADWLSPDDENEGYDVDPGTPIFVFPGETGDILKVVIPTGLPADE